MAKFTSFYGIWKIHMRESRPLKENTEIFFFFLSRLVLATDTNRKISLFGS